MEVVMEQEKISVIVSAYNVEKYIEKCLFSLLNQTYKNLEIIVVDDCSTDNTLSILKRFEKKILVLKFWKISRIVDCLIQETEQ